MHRTTMPIDEVQENKYLNQYDLEKFREFEEKAEFGIKYRIDEDRPDIKEYILMLKKRMVIYGDVYIWGKWEYVQRIFVPKYEEQDYIDYWTRRLSDHYSRNTPSHKIIDFIKPTKKKK